MKPLRSKDYPTTHLFNPLRVYVPAAATDIAATFEKVRRQQEAASIVVPMRRKK